MDCEKKVLLTGATGLIGREIIKPLEEAGFDIYAITIDDILVGNNVHWLKGNLFDENFIKKSMEEIKPKYLLNLAWATTGNYLTSEINYSFLNAGINLLKHFKDNGGKRAIYAGTCFEYKFKNKPLKEIDVLDCNKSVYTFCKNRLREIAHDFCKKNGISFGYGRIFYVFGKNENKSRLFGMVIDKLSKDEKVIIKSGNLIKDYMYTKDIAAAFTKFLNSSVEGIVNICSAKPISVRDFVLEIARQMKKEHLIIFEDEKTKEFPIILGDNSRLIKEVGYNIKYSCQEAIHSILK